MAKVLERAINSARGRDGWPLRAIAAALDARQPELCASLLAELLADRSQPTMPVRAHAARLASGDRGLSRVALRALRAFYHAHGALDKLMGDVCKEGGFAASVCALTRSTGLSLAESLVLRRAAGDRDVGALVGRATTFFSYSWTGTRLGDMLDAIERTLGALEAADGRVRYVWVDMFAASQTLLAGAFLPEAPEARARLKADDRGAYAARKEDTDTIFDSALGAVDELLLFCSPLADEWAAPPHAFLLPDRGEPPQGWWRKGAPAFSRAWCLFEIVSALAKGCELHVVLSEADMHSFEALLTERFDEIAHIVASLDARDAQISKVDDREYILSQVATLDGGLSAVTARVCAAMRKWLAAEGRAALERMPAAERGTSTLINNLGSLLKLQGDREGAAALLREALQARRETLGDRDSSTLTSINNLGSLLQAKGDLEGAAPLLREALQARRETLGDRHPSTLASIFGMSVLLYTQGEEEEAQRLCREAVTASRETLGEEHPDTKARQRNPWQIR